MSRQLESLGRIRRETLRYLGYGNATPALLEEQLVDWAIAETEKAAVPACCFREFPLESDEAGTLHIGGERIRSRNLSRNAAGCERMILFAATLGADVDRLIGKYSRLNMAKAVALQAAAAAFLEEYCDSENEKLKETYRQDGWYLRPRFSPGYGDFPISFQKSLLLMLDAQKRIGLTMTDGCMLVPVKSVTAVIGIGRREVDCPLSGCEACGKKDCSYRRNQAERRQNR